MLEGASLATDCGGNVQFNIRLSINIWYALLGLYLSRCSRVEAITMLSNCHDVRLVYIFSDLQTPLCLSAREKEVEAIRRRGNRNKKPNMLVSGVTVLLLGLAVGVVYFPSLLMTLLSSPQ